MIFIMVMMEMVTVNTINLNFDHGNNDRYHHDYGCDDDVTTDKVGVQIQNLLNIILVRDDEASG